MIEFRIDPRTGLSPYRQLIHQVHAALRLGRLDIGDQLPVVKDVVAKVAINQKHSALDAALGDAHEVAFFPPVTGG